MHIGFGWSASVLGLAVLSACSDEGRPERRLAGDALPWVSRSGWSSTLAADVGEKLGGCALGDVDTSQPGNEIVAVGVSGKVHLVGFVSGAWTHAVIGQAGGEMVQVALGEIDLDRPGLEIVVVGMASGTEDQGGEGAAHVLFRDEGEWIMKEFARSPALLHAAAVTELDGSLGAEVVLAGFARQAVVMDLTDAGWVEQPVGPLPGAGKNAIEHGGGVVIACANGSLMAVQRAEGAYALSELAVAPAGCARLASDGEHLLVARDDGVLWLVEGGQGSELFREPTGEKLRGAVLANLDPLQPALEAATVGYSKRITLLTHQENGWQPTILYEDTDRLHHLAGGLMPGVGHGEHLVACGFSGHILVLRRDG